jgi:hypothetical protein
VYAESIYTESLELHLSPAEFCALSVQVIVPGESLLVNVYGKLPTSWVSRFTVPLYGALHVPEADTEPPVAAHDKVEVTVPLAGVVTVDGENEVAQSGAPGSEGTLSGGSILTLAVTE